MSAAATVATPAPSHLPVLYAQVLEGLRVRADGIYLDGTFGRGGHSRLILEQLGADGHLLGFDKDPLAIATGQALAQLLAEIDQLPADTLHPHTS